MHNYVLCSGGSILDVLLVISITLFVNLCEVNTVKVVFYLNVYRLGPETICNIVQEAGIKVNQIIFSHRHPADLSGYWYDVWLTSALHNHDFTLSCSFELAMFLYNLTLQRATGITHAIHGNFSGAKLQEIVVSRGKLLELMRPDPNTGKVYTLLTHEVFGVIRSLMPFKLTGGSKGNRLLLINYSFNRFANRVNLLKKVRLYVIQRKYVFACSCTSHQIFVLKPFSFIPILQITL